MPSITEPTYVVVTNANTWGAGATLDDALKNANANGRPRKLGLVIHVLSPLVWKGFYVCPITGAVTCKPTEGIRAYFDDAEALQNLFQDCTMYATYHRRALRVYPTIDDVEDALAN